MKTLVTGNAGFIGFHVAKRLLERGDDVVGIDSVNDYYDTFLKESRLRILEETAESSVANYTFYRGNIADRDTLKHCFDSHKFDRVIHLAAQAGVRYSLVNPYAYLESNLTGFGNILECCRQFKIAHLTYASSSSVYGAGTKMPFSIHDGVDHPLQLYAATKIANEKMAHSYSHLYQLPVTGLRFFTVYGPWSRPDMAMLSFARDIDQGNPIKVFNFGRHKRDFTYIDDIVDGVLLASDKPAASNPNWDSKNPDPATGNCPYRLYNLGCGNPVELNVYIESLEKALGKTAIKTFLPMQPGDISETSADISDTTEDLGYCPKIDVTEGVARFAEWYKSYRDKDKKP